MARRRRPEQPNALAQDGLDEGPGHLVAEDWLDPRVWLLADAPCNAPYGRPDAAEMLAWARERCPGFILSDREARGRARRRVRRAELAAMTPEQQRAATASERLIARSARAGR